MNLVDANNGTTISGASVTDDNGSEAGYEYPEGSGQYDILGGPGFHVNVSATGYVPTGVTLGGTGAKSFTVKLTPSI